MNVSETIAILRNFPADADVEFHIEGEGALYQMMPTSVGRPPHYTKELIGVGFGLRPLSRQQLQTIAKSHPRYAGASTKS
jgi:hypothetical protein